MGCEMKVEKSSLCFVRNESNLYLKGDVKSNTQAILKFFLGGWVLRCFKLRSNLGTESESTLKLFVKVYKGVSLDLASCRLYLGVTFQAIASPCPFGARALRCHLRQIAHSAAVSCSRDSASAAAFGRSHFIATMHSLPNVIALFSSLTQDLHFGKQASKLCRLFQTDSSC